jgi:hypothetical protein
MATLNAYVPFSSDTFTLWEGDIVTATPEYVRIIAGAQVQELIGNGFAFDSEGDITGGTLGQTNYWLNGQLQYEMAGLNHSLLTITNYFDSANWQGLLAYLFSGSDTFNGSAGNDVLNGFGADDAIYGGAGADTARYSGNRGNYVIGGTAPNFTVAGPDGSDTLTGIERLRFADRGIAFDLGPGEAAASTVRVIGAALNETLIIPEFVGIGLQLFDAGMSMTQVCELVANQVLRLSDAAFVTQVFTNVVGTPPEPGVRDDFVDLLQGSGGPLTQGQLLEVAANTDLNALQINLVGLQASGVEFV